MYNFRTMMLCVCYHFWLRKDRKVSISCRSVCVEYCAQRALKGLQGEFKGAPNGVLQGEVLEVLCGRPQGEI